MNKWLGDDKLGKTWKETVVSPFNVSHQFHEDSEEKHETRQLR
jgi:hypothetical protein